MKIQNFSCPLFELRFSVARIFKVNILKENWHNLTKKRQSRRGPHLLRIYWVTLVTVSSFELHSKFVRCTLSSLLMQASLCWVTCSKIAQRAVKLSSTSIFSPHLKAAAGDEAWEECGVGSKRGERWAACLAGLTKPVMISSALFHLFSARGCTTLQKKEKC